MKIYAVNINGLPHTFRLSDEQAKERGLKPSDGVEAKATQPANKARTASNKKG